MSHRKLVVMKDGFVCCVSCGCKLDELGLGEFLLYLRYVVRNNDPALCERCERELARTCLSIGP